MTKTIQEKEELLSQINRLQEQLTSTQQTPKQTNNETISQEMFDALKREKEELQQEIEKQRNASKILETKLQEAIEKPAEVTSNQPSNVISIDEFKDLLKNLYSRAGETFVNEEDVEQLADESLKKITIQTSKANLKRLREVIREITSDKLASASS